VSSVLVLVGGVVAGDVVVGAGATGTVGKAVVVGGVVVTADGVVAM
jgi:hypothetical protein